MRWELQNGVTCSQRNGLGGMFMHCVLRKIAALHVSKQWRDGNEYVRGNRHKANARSRLHETLKVYAEIDETNAGNVALFANFVARQPTELAGYGFDELECAEAGVRAFQFPGATKKDVVGETCE